MDRIDAMRAFCTVVEAGGFAAAASHLGLSTSAVSRHVAQLETHLNSRLLTRTTRRVHPTEAGEAYYERAIQWLSELEEVEAVVAGESLHPRGRLRLTAPLALSIHRLAPAFSAFKQRYADVTLDVLLSDNLVDFAGEGVDLAIRVGRVGSENLVARLIDEAALVVVAAPSYLAERGTPEHPDALADHDCMAYSYAATGNVWQFESRDGDALEVRISGSVRANNGMVLAEMAVAGSGIAHVPDFLAAPYLNSGALVSLLDDWACRKLPIHAVYPTRRHLSARVQAMVTFLTEWFARERAAQRPNSTP